MLKSSGLYPAKSNVNFSSFPLLPSTIVPLFVAKSAVFEFAADDDVDSAAFFNENSLNCLVKPVGLTGGRKFELSSTGISIIKVPSCNKLFFSFFTSAPCGSPISLLNSPIIKIK